VRVKWKRDQIPSFDSDSALKAFFATNCGTVDSLVVSTKFCTKPNTKSGSAVVSFHTISAAVKAVDLATKKANGFEHLEVTWTGGKSPFPAHNGGISQPASPIGTNGTPDLPNLPKSSPKIDEDETLNLLRRRQRERERLEEEIRRQDELEEVATE